MNKKKHLQKEERFLIEKMLRIGKNLSYISRLLERGISTVSEEVSRNGGRSEYSSYSAQNKANTMQLRKKEKLNKVISNKRIRNIVDKLLSINLSPEIISNKLRSKSLLVSSKSIRKYRVLISR